MASVRLRRNVNIGRAIGKIVTIVLVLWLGDQIIGSVAGTINTTGSYFAKAFEFIGVNEPGKGILPVIGIIGAASVVMEFVEINL